MRKLAIVAVSVAALVGAGCTALGRAAFQEPVVTLQDVQLRGLGLTGGSFDVRLAVYNPNGFRLDATRMTYRLQSDLPSDTVVFATGMIEGLTTFPEKDTSYVTVPVDFTYAGIGAVGRQLLNSGAVNYTVAGELTVATPVGNFTRPYQHSGRYRTLSGR